MFEIQVLNELGDEFFKLRHKVLRQGQPFDTVHYHGIDTDSLTRHIGFFKEEGIIGCATMQVDERPYCRFRIRGMAVEENSRGQGIGTQMVKYFQQIAAQERTGIWCNARILAVPMYARCGFEIISDVFEIEHIGPHYDMEWKHD